MSDFPSEAIIVLFFLLISFLSWITEKVKTHRAEKPSQPSPLQAERQAPRRPPPRAERRAPPRAPERSQREAPKKEGSDTMREILRSLGIPAEPEEETPPPLPPSEVPAAVEAVPISAKARRIAKTEAKAKAATDKVQDALSKQELEALKHVKSQGEKVQRRKSRYHSSPARTMLKRQNLQSAVIVKEILDKPRCLRPIDE